MKPALEATFKQLKAFWSSQTRKMRILIAASAAGLLLLCVTIAVLLNTDHYVVLYRGLSTAESSEILSKLDTMDVSTKVEKDGTILVPEKEEATLKMQLASEGYPKSSLDYDIFKNNTDFMTTDYEKKKYLVFQLQNRLQDAIKTIHGVQNAIVTINVPEDSSFVLDSDKTPATASVVLALDGNIDLSNKQVKGIELLVAKSVPGLNTGNVVIVDGTGMILNSAGSDGESDAAYQKLEIANALSEAMKSKISTLLEPVFGKNGIRVAVNVVMDFDKKVSEEKTYSPVVGDKGVVSRENITQENSNGQSGQSGVPGTSANTNVNTYPESGNKSNSSSSQTASTEYLVNQSTQSIQNDGGAIKDVSVAVIINNKDLSDEEIGNYKKLIASAAGVEPDKVVITASEFSNAKSIEAFAHSALNQSGISWTLILGGGALLLVAIGLIVFLISRRKQAKKKKVINGTETKEEDFYLSAPGSAMRLGKDGKAQEIPGEIVLNETRELGLKRQIKDFSGANPEIVAQLLRTWIREEDGGNR